MPTRKHGEFEPREDIFCPLPLPRAFPAPRFPRGFRRALGTGLGSAGGGEAPATPEEPPWEVGCAGEELDIRETRAGKRAFKEILTR